MKLSFFGRLRDAVGAAELERTVLPHVTDSEEIRRWIGADYPALLDPSVRIAIDDVLAACSVPIEGASEVAFLPPVSGG